MTHSFDANIRLLPCSGVLPGKVRHFNTAHREHLGSSQFLCQTAAVMIWIDPDYPRRSPRLRIFFWHLLPVKNGMSLPHIESQRVRSSMRSGLPLLRQRTGTSTVLKALGLIPCSAFIYASNHFTAQADIGIAACSHAWSNMLNFPAGPPAA